MKLIKTTFTGIGQIFLQENGLSGLVIVIAMFFSHWTLGVSCFLGALIGTLTAKILKYPPMQISQGLYGFNASLSFMCTMFTFAEVDASNPLIWGIGVLASIVSTLMMHFFMKKNKVAFTFPFVLSCWFFCWGIAKLGLFGLIQTTPPLADYTDTLAAIQEPFYAWAEVNFGTSMTTGALLFLAVALNSPIAAMYGLAAATIGTALAFYLPGISQNSLINGLYGFSPILVACAFAGTRLRDFLFVIIGVVLAILIQYAVAQTGLATYTIGFIVASWIVLILKKRLDKTLFNKHKIVHLLNP